MRYPIPFKCRTIKAFARAIATIALLLAGCAPISVQITIGDKSPTPTAAYTPTPTLTPSPTPTETTTPEPTASLPSATPTSSAKAGLVQWGEALVGLEKQQASLYTQIDDWHRRNASGQIPEGEQRAYGWFVDLRRVLSNRISSMREPLEAARVHEEFNEVYTDSYDATRFYYEFLTGNNVERFNEYLTTYRTQRDMVDTAYADLRTLLDQYELAPADIGLSLAMISARTSEYVLLPPNPAIWDEGDQIVWAAGLIDKSGRPQKLPPYPQGMGSLTIVNYRGQAMTFTVNNNSYDIAAVERLEFFLPPGTFTYSANWADQAYNNGTVEITVEQPSALSFAD